MRSLDHAKQRARELRQQIGSESEGLLERVRARIEDHHQIELIPVPAAVIDEGRAELSPAERSLNYDERLNHKPADLLWVLAHELGHLTLHARLTKHDAPPDPLLGSAYLNDGAAALARYSRRAREEAEANAFANEFICPAQDVFEEWRNEAEATSFAIAKRRGVPEKIVRVQLAEALFNWQLAPTENAAPKIRRAFECDESQLAAARFTGAPALVTAGPGTGKTATLVRRIELLLTEHEAAPDSLLVLTFSNEAAGELRDRIAARFGAAIAAEMEIATFHGFGLSFLHSHALDLDPDAAILDEAAQHEVITELIGTVDCPNLINLRDPAETVKRMAKHINYLKDRVIDDQPITPELLATELDRWQPTGDETKLFRKSRELLEFFRAYEQAKTARPAVDFADLIAMPIRLLSTHDRLRERVREKYKWVLVDEYQDVSRAVALLLRLLCGDDNPPWVVGDLRQAIYRFRGAAPENVLRFTEDFPDAKVFELEINYRSCPEVVEAANQLASLMQLAASDNTSSDIQRSSELSATWRAGTDIAGIGEQVIAVARANSDSSESDGIAAQVRAWIESGVAAQDIAVLARRNIDVRNIVLALGARGIRATTSGLMTPEGAAGDLAAVITLMDQTASSLPRVVFSLGRGRYDNEQLNAVTEKLISACEADDWLKLASGDDEQNHELVSEIRRLCETLQSEFHSSDAFSLMCAFLFNGSEYLRRTISENDPARLALALSEIMTALSRAAGYRVTHPDTDPLTARIGFAQYFRGTLSSSTPSLAAPQAETDAVRVMTCHASKGLEFPCVIVAGQTLSQMREEMWLPDSLQPSQADERAQADALFFVGVTRAKRALVVSCAESKSGTQRATSREVTPLLERWQERQRIGAAQWSAPTAPKEKLPLAAIWGGALRGGLAAAKLDENNCATRSYLEDFLGLRFPESLRSLYPLFITSVRASLESALRRAHETGAAIPPAEAALMFSEKFSRSASTTDHPHFKLYHDTGQVFLRRFARAYQPPAQAVEFLDPNELISATDHTLLPLRADLIACYRRADGTTHALTFRPESLAESVSKKQSGALPWSALKAGQRMAFLLLKDRVPDLQPRVFSATDGLIYDFLWNQRPANQQIEADRVAARWQAFTNKQFETKLNERNCDRCPTRIVCPHWMGTAEQ